jgi:hypothetical protein
LQAPGLHRQLQTTYVEGQAPSTRSNYHTAVFGPNGYSTIIFDLYSTVAFPASPTSICFYVRFAAATVSLPVLRGYVSGVRSHQVDLDLAWFAPSDTLERVWRSLEREIGIPGVAPQATLAMDMLLPIRALLDIEESHDDRVFWACLIWPVLVGLRGGEFLWRTGNKKSKLLTCDRVSFTVRPGDTRSLPYQVHVKDSKTLFKDHHLQVEVPRVKSDDRVCPATALADMLERAPPSALPATGDRPLFMLLGGAIVSFEYFKARLTELLTMIDRLPINPITMKIARRTYVTGATKANFPSAVIRQGGRWAAGSNAYQAYLDLTAEDSDANASTLVASTAPTVTALEAPVPSSVRPHSPPTTERGQVHSYVDDLFVVTHPSSTRTSTATTTTPTTATTTTTTTTAGGAAQSSALPASSSGRRRRKPARLDH